MRRRRAPARCALRAALAATACAASAGLDFHPAVVAAAAAPAPQPLCFYALADWGGEQLAPFTTPGQLAVARSMGNLSTQAGLHPSFVLAAGDNFYMDGLAAPMPAPATAARVRATFSDVYTGQGLQVPWYFVAGNHDWVGNVTAELLLNGSAITGGRWIMPSTYYTFTRPLPGGLETVQFVMIDTETLTGGANPKPTVMPNLYYPPGAATSPASPAARRLAAAAAGQAAGGPRRGGQGDSSVQSAAQRRRLQQSSEDDPGMDSPLDPPVPPSWVPPPVNEAQWAWIESTLSASTADWIIVVGHHPVWSVGEYGPTWPLVERLAPLMEAAGVALYVCGHEHMMEHFRSEPHDTGVDYLVVGNGAYYNDTAPADTSHAADCPYGSLQFQYASGTGFAALLLTPGIALAPTQLSATLYDGTGKQLYDFYKGNPRTTAGHTAGNLGAPPGPGARASSSKSQLRRSIEESAVMMGVFAAAVGGLFCATAAARQAVLTDAQGRRASGGARGVLDDRMAAWEAGRSERKPLVGGGAEMTSSAVRGTGRSSNSA